MYTNIVYYDVYFLSPCIHFLSPCILTVVRIQILPICLSLDVLSIKYVNQRLITNRVGPRVELNGKKLGSAVLTAELEHAGFL